MADPAFGWFDVLLLVGMARYYYLYEIAQLANVTVVKRHDICNGVGCYIRRGISVSIIHV